MKRICLLLVTVLFMSAAGCEMYPQDEYREYYVVESYLVANRALPQVRVSRTLPVEETYSLSKAAISDATVEIHLLDENDEVEKVYSYVHQSNGIYQPANAATVLPERRYELKVFVSQTDDEITARTLVPGSFQSVGTVVDSITYQSDEQIRITTTRSAYPGRQSFFIFTVNVVDPDRNNLTPFYEDRLSEENDSISNLYINSSGIINEDNYDYNPDSTLTLRLPWLAVAFYGDNDITANAIDDNMYDYLRSQNVQGGGSTLPPGEIQNIRYNVDGGIGVFGSLASDTVRVYIKRQ